MQILGVTGTWAAACGTVLIACIALYIAIRVEKVKVRVNYFVGTEVDTELEHFVVSVTNLSTLPVTVKMINWRYRVENKTRIIPLQIHPKTIGHGESVDYMEGPFGGNLKFLPMNELSTLTRFNLTLIDVPTE